MANKYIISTALTALLFGCGKSDNQNLESITQTYQDKTLETARKNIQSEDYKVAISLLNGYTSTDQKTVAQRNFLLGEATLKAISRSHLMALWAPYLTGDGDRPFFHREYKSASREFKKKHEEAESSFKAALSIEPRLEKRLDEIYILRNGKIPEISGNDPKSILLLKRLYAYSKANDINAIRTLTGLKIDFDQERREKLAELEKRQQEHADKIRRTKRGDRIREELERIERDYPSFRDKILKTPDSELLDEKLKSSGYGLHWLTIFNRSDFNTSEVVILTADDKAAEFLIIDPSDNPELHLKTVKVSDDGKLEPFIGK